MSKSLRVVVGLLAGSAIGGLALFVAAIAAGAGHGTYIAAKLLFPYAMALTSITGTISEPLIAASVLQYPIYGLGLALFSGNRRVWFGPVCITAIHLPVVILALAISSPAFNP